MINEAIILAGGLGTRLRGVVNDVPKSMAPINNRPFLEYQLNYLEATGVDRIIFSVGYKNEYISRHFKERFNNLRICYSIENEPLGTGGAAKLAFERVEGHAAFVLNGDSFFDVNLYRMHDYSRIKDAKVCLAVKKVSDVSRYGAIDMDGNNRVKGFTEKGVSQGKGYINGGIYLMNKAHFNSFELPAKFSIEKDFFEQYYQTESLYGMKCQGYFLDIGIPEDYAKAQNEFKGLNY